ncbi:MAG TPA: hypothetical protein VLA74_14870 [Nitrososphaeraceae archaeon]|nr:hypothetical protein [Nitrososphaeraceae archaeon]
MTKGQNLLEYFKKRFDEAHSIKGLEDNDYRQYFSIFSNTLSRIPDEEFDKIVNALEVFRRLRPRKYKYKEYITIKVDVLFLTNLNNMQVRIGYSQL